MSERPRHAVSRLSALAAALLLDAPAGAVQAQVQEPPSRPFAPGERLSYQVQFSGLKVGTGALEVRGIETVRGRPAYHTVFQFRGKIIGFAVNDVFESWFAVDDLSSLRFHKEQDEGPRESSDRYEIYPERATYDDLLDKKGEQPSVSNPLDDGSFLYFIRTVPLETGQTYQFTRYFKPDRNPVAIRVLRRERVKVPAGTFDAVVVRPIINAKGIFSEGGHAEVWLSDDERRLVLQVKSRLSFGSLNLFLTSYKPGG
jgi:hypothetical protein